MVNPQIREAMANTLMGGNTYKVMPGDNLWSLSKKFYGDPNLVDQIAKLNNISDPSMIQPGQMLKMPGAHVVEPPTPRPAPNRRRPGDVFHMGEGRLGVYPVQTLNPTIETGSGYPDGFTPNTRGSAPYVVKSGDTLWDIAEKNLGSGDKWQEIQQASGLEGDVIHPGQELSIPGSGPKPLQVREGAWEDVARQEQLRQARAAALQGINIPMTPIPGSGPPPVPAEPPRSQTSYRDNWAPHGIGLVIPTMGATPGLSQPIQTRVNPQDNRPPPGVGPAPMSRGAPSPMEMGSPRPSALPGVREGLPPPSGRRGPPPVGLGIGPSRPPNMMEGVSDAINERLGTVADDVLKTIGVREGPTSFGQPSDSSPIDNVADLNRAEQRTRPVPPQAAGPMYNGRPVQWDEGGLPFIVNPDGTKTMIDETKISQPTSKFQDRLPDMDRKRALIQMLSNPGM